jgi:hypothetical protein
MLMVGYDSHLWVIRLLPFAAAAQAISVYFTAAISVLVNP